MLTIDTNKNITLTETDGIFRKITTAVSDTSFLSIELLVDVQINVIIHDMSPFNRPPEMDKQIHGIYLLGQENYEIKSNNILYPTIHISLFDFFDNSETGKEVLKNGVAYLPRYIKVIDSNIWNYYVPYHKFDNNIPCFSQRLQNAIKEICENYNRGLYAARNAQEKAEFTKRLTENSYLHSIGGHTKNIVPFVFHSETEMLCKAEKMKDKLEKTGNLEWRFLLVDDHATKQSVEGDINYKKEGNGNSNIIPKCKIINRILSKYFNVECYRQAYGTNQTEAKACCNECCCKTTENKKITILFDCVTEMKDVIEKLKTTKYDVILMDYLLDKKEDGTRNYAHSVLHEIKKHFEGGTNDKSEWQKIAGPNGLFHFFFISTFVNAMQERLFAEGMVPHTEYWHISRGACPTTTPHLFSYYLLQTLNLQIQFLETKYKDINNKTITLLDFLYEIYTDFSQSRGKAIKNFNNFLELRAKYDKLKYDVVYQPDGKTKLADSAKSKLINSLFPDIPYYDNAFWEHTMHLVYLTAFGTIRQWHDMWDEFMLIKPYLSRIPDSVKVKYKDNKGNIKNDKTAKDIIEAIEKYITDLQTQSR